MFVPVRMLDIHDDITNNPTIFSANVCESAHDFFIIGASHQYRQRLITPSDRSWKNHSVTF